MNLCKLHNEIDKFLMYCSLGEFDHRPVRYITVSDILTDMMLVSIFPVSIGVYLSSGVWYRVSRKLPKTVTDLYYTTFYCDDEESYSEIDN